MRIFACSLLCITVLWFLWVLRTQFDREED